MKLLVSAIGRLRDGPEAELSRDYLARAQRLSRPLGFSGPDLHEFEAHQAGDKSAEAALLQKPLPPGALRVALDERGADWTSQAFSDRLARWRDDGVPAVCFLIGGPDGLAEDLKNGPHAIAFGRQTWPHRLVRVMLAEQIYRALTILAGAPYHRS